MGLGDWISEQVDSVKEVFSEAKEDVEELAVLADDFKDLVEVQIYFEEEKENLEDIDVIDIFKDPKGVAKQIEEASEKIEQANRAAEEIKKTNLKFSDDYLGETVEELEEVLDGLDGYFDNLFHEIVDPSTLKGRIAKKLMLKKKYKEVTEVSLTLKKIKKNIGELKDNLDSLIDPGLKEDSNNDFLNPLLEVKETYEEKRKSYERLKKIAEALEKANELRKKVSSYFGDEE